MIPEMTKDSICQIQYNDEERAKVAFAKLIMKGYTVEQKIKYKFAVSHEGCEYLKGINLKPDTEKKL